MSDNPNRRGNARVLAISLGVILFSLGVAGFSWRFFCVAIGSVLIIATLMDIYED